MRAVHKRYNREFFPAMVGYAVMLLGSVWLLRRGIEGRALRATITLLPALPIVLVIRAMIRVIRDQDELERRIDLEAIAAAGAVTGFGFLTYGLLLSGNVLASPSAETVAMWVMPVLFATFGVAKCAFRYHHLRP
jgi:uncharacterized membrane protein